MHKHQLCIVLIQKSKYYWQLQSESGNIVQDDLYFNDELQAVEYTKAYISSYLGWTYKVRVL